nr:hypothetical protein [Pollutimonas thiosulfatoxidans]
MAELDYPPEIRRVIYTTKAIESLNRVIRQLRARRWRSAGGRTTP